MSFAIDSWKRSVAWSHNLRVLAYLRQLRGVTVEVLLSR